MVFKRWSQATNRKFGTELGSCDHGNLALRGHYAKGRHDHPFKVFLPFSVLFWGNDETSILIYFWWKIFSHYPSKVHFYRPQTVYSPPPVLVPCLDPTPVCPPLPPSRACETGGQREGQSLAHQVAPRCMGSGIWQVVAGLQTWLHP